MNSIQKLTDYFSQFPGIGPRQARRFVYFLLTENDPSLTEFARLIKNLKSDIAVCASCFRFFQKKEGMGGAPNTKGNAANGSGTSLCDICSNTHRDDDIRMIVSRDADLETVERARVYNGKYFVLGGTVPILEKDPVSKIRQRELLAMIETEIPLKEIIIAMNATTEGEHTGDYLLKLLQPMAAKRAIKISALGRGISTGTELEYSDADTIKNALNTRL